MSEAWDGIIMASFEISVSPRDVWWKLIVDAERQSELEIEKQIEWEALSKSFGYEAMGL